MALVPARILVFGGAALLVTGLVVGVRIIKRPQSRPASPNQSQPTTVSTAEAIRPIASRFPEADSASCVVARQRASELLKQIELQVDPGLRASAATYVAKRNSATSTGRAWDDFAIAMLLKGDAAAASWAGLSGISADWDADRIANLGVYLIYLGKLDDALVFLNCSYSMGLRSPYLLEALSTLFRKRGDQDKSRNYILLASELAPEDIPILVEKSIATTGGPPPSSPPGSSRDALDIALARLEQHAQRVLNVLSLAAAEYDQLEEDTHKQARAQEMTHLYATINMDLGYARDTARRARTTREEFRKDLEKKGGTFSEQLFQRMSAMNYNLALVSCIQNYIQITDEMLRFFSGGEDQAMAGPASRLAFWADVLYMNPKLLATEWKQANDGQFKSIGSGAIVTWGSFFTAWPSKQYQDEVRAAIRRHSSAALTDQAALCGEIEAAYSTWLDEVSRRFNHAAPHFDVVARSTMVWGKQEVQDARGYSLEALAGLKPTRAPAQVSGKDDRSNFIAVANNAYVSLLRRVLDPNNSGDGLAAYLKKQAANFHMQQQAMQEALASERANIEKPAEYVAQGCAAVRKEYLELLAEQAWQEYLNELQNRMKEDLEVSYDPTGNCDFELGPATVNVDDTGKWEMELKKEDFLQGLEGKIKASFEDKTEFSGVDATLGQSLEGFPPFTGDAEGTLFVETNPKTGKLDGGLAFEGKLGVGYKKEGHIFGRKVGFGIGCYPGTVTAKFYARAFYDHTTEYIKADISRSQ